MTSGIGQLFLSPGALRVYCICTPNLKLECFVCLRLKIINTFLRCSIAANYPAVLPFPCRILSFPCRLLSFPCQSFVFSLPYFCLFPSTFVFSLPCFCFNFPVDFCLSPVKVLFFFSLPYFVLSLRLLQFPCDGGVIRNRNKVTEY